MLQKEPVQCLLLAVAALSITVEIVGLFSPGWLCLSVKYLSGSPTANTMQLTGDIGEQLDTSGHSGVRLPSTTVPSSKKPLRSRGGNLGGNGWQNNRTIVPSAKQEARVFADFISWTKKRNITELKTVPRNLTEFKNWMYKDKNNFITIRRYLNKFINLNGQNTALVYFHVVQYWLRGGADNPNHPNVLENLPNANNKADVSEFKKAMIYSGFKAFINRTVGQQLPGNYSGFVKWLAEDVDRIKQMESRYDYFKKMIFNKYPRNKVDLFETVIESWFDQALKHNRSGNGVNGNQDVWFDPSALLGNVEVKIKLGLWYGRECLHDQCSSTDASKLQENDIGKLKLFYVVLLCLL